jgi:hypothetical protein
MTEMKAILPALILFGAVAFPILAVEVDLMLYRCCPWIRRVPSSGVISALFLILFLFAVGYVINTAGIGRIWGVSALVVSALIWVGYLRIRAR